MANTVPALWSFLPCAMKKRREGCPESKSALPVLFMIVSFWVFLISSARKGTRLEEEYKRQ